MSVSYDLLQLRWTGVRSFEKLMQVEDNNLSLRKQIDSLTQMNSNLESDNQFKRNICDRIGNLRSQIHTLQQEKNSIKLITKQELSQYENLQMLLLNSTAQKISVMNLHFKEQIKLLVETNESLNLKIEDVNKMNSQMIQAKSHDFEKVKSKLNRLQSQYEASIRTNEEMLGELEQKRKDLEFSKNELLKSTEKYIVSDIYCKCK